MINTWLILGDMVQHGATVTDRVSDWMGQVKTGITNTGPLCFVQTGLAFGNRSWIWNT